jgi:hypothetical protein
MDVVSLSNMFVSTCKAIQCHNLENHNLFLSATKNKRTEVKAGEDSSLLQCYAPWSISCLTHLTIEVTASLTFTALTMVVYHVNYTAFVYNIWTFIFKLLN